MQGEQMTSTGVVVVDDSIDVSRLLYGHDTVGLASATQQMQSSVSQIATAEAVYNSLAKINDTIVEGPLLDENETAALNLAIEHLCQSVGLPKGHKLVPALEANQEGQTAAWDKFKAMMKALWEGLKKALLTLVDWFRKIGAHLVGKLAALERRLQAVHDRYRHTKATHSQADLAAATQALHEAQEKLGLFVREVMVENNDHLDEKLTAGLHSAANDDASHTEPRGVPAIHNRTLGHFFRSTGANEAGIQHIFHGSQLLMTIGARLQGGLGKEMQEMWSIQFSPDTAAGSSVDKGVDFVKTVVDQHIRRFFKSAALATHLMADKTAQAHDAPGADVVARVYMPFDRYLEVTGNAEQCVYHVTQHAYTTEGGDYVQVCPGELIEKAMDLIGHNCSEIKHHVDAFEAAAKAMEDQFQGEYQRFAQLFADHSDGALNDKFDEDGGADGLREKLKNQAMAKRFGKNGVTSMLQYASLLLGYNETFSAMMLEWVSASLNVLDKYATHAKAA